MTRAAFANVELRDVHPIKLRAQFAPPQLELPKTAARWNTWGAIEITGADATGFTFAGTGDSGVWRDVQVSPKSAQRFTVSVVRTDEPLPPDAGFVELRLETTLAGKQVAIASREFDIAKFETTGGASTLALEVVSQGRTLRALIRVVPGHGGQPARLKFISPQLESR
jgi:hypothetical protein